MPLNGMIRKIDKADWVILPKPARDRLGLHEGSNLDMQETSDGVLLKPTDNRPSIVKKEGHTVKVPPGFDIVQAIRDDRDERIRMQAGLCNPISIPTSWWRPPSNNIRHSSWSRP